MAPEKKSPSTSKCFSVTAFHDRCLRFKFKRSGLRPSTFDLGDGTTVHSWVPSKPDPQKPDVILIHGFGVNSLWQFSDTVPSLTPHFNVYVPDLLFFGSSATSRPDRSEKFQAQCVRRMAEAAGVSLPVSAVLGLSYGGFVAYSMAAMFGEEWVERVVICCAGVCLEEKDIREGMFPVPDVEAAAEILLAQTPEKLRELVRLTFVKTPRWIPSCLLNDFIDVMCTDYVEEKKELLRAIPQNRTMANLPKISQPTLIVWGDKDRVFPLELAFRLKSHLGEKAELVVIKDSGHGFIHEKSKEFHRHLKNFLLNKNNQSSQHSKKIDCKITDDQLVV